MPAAVAGKSGRIRVQTDIAGQLYVLAHTLGVVPLRLEAYAQNRDWPFRWDLERVLLVPLLPQHGRDDFLIMDRGFPSVWLFTLLQQRQLLFLARMDGNQWPVVECFLRSGLAETVIQQTVSAHARRHDTGR